MFDSDIWQEILLTIKRNKWRSLMTAFGVFWGILMLIILVGCGFGLQEGVLGGVKSIPTNTIFMGANRTSMPYKGFRKDRRFNLAYNDVEYIRRELGHKCKFVIAMNWMSGDATVSYGTKSGTYSIAGVMPDYIHSEPQKLLYGRFINDIDLRERRKVCVLGERVYKEIFPKDTDPTGALVKAGNIYYTVVGVTRKTTEMTVGGDTGESLQIPLTTEQQVYKEGDNIDLLITTLAAEYSATDYQDVIEGWLKERHMIHPDDPSAFWSFNLAKMFASFQSLFNGIAILIWIVGGGTLLAGLIGISNIMLVTVKERTQEIGIRRALGAKPLTILGQIMAESLVLTAIAGVTGLMLGVWVLALISSGMKANPTEGTMFAAPQVSFSVGLLALGVLIVGGLLAGWLPSYRAMKIKAIEALREE